MWTICNFYLIRAVNFLDSHLIIEYLIRSCYSHTRGRFTNLDYSESVPLVINDTGYRRIKLTVVT